MATSLSPSRSTPMPASSAPSPPTSLLAEVSLPLVLGRPVEAFGLRCTLAGRTHKELAEGEGGVVGVWGLLVERDGAEALEVHVVASSPYAEGSESGATWILRGQYDEGQIFVRRGETRPLEQDDLRARAVRAAGRGGGGPAEPLVESEDHGVYTAVFKASAGAIRVSVGVYTGTVVAVETTP